MANDRPGGGETRSTISGGTFYEPVLMGRDVHVTIPATAPVALAQLPSLIAGFTGREPELAMMKGLLDPGGAAGAVVVSAVAGLAGVGKTALAVQAGHAARERGWFRGGVLFVDLHGYDPRPVEPGQALDALLRGLGVAAEHIPPGAEARAGLYRSVLAGISEPVLVIADNASSEAQVRPLLPGGGPHRVVVTSRHTLGSLDARLLDVTILDDAAGVALLDAALHVARPDDERISDDLEAAGRLAGICGGLPLALRIVAALLKADPARGVNELADELAVERVRLEGLRYDDGGGAGALSVAAAFELSYRRLDDTPARLFRALPLGPGPDLSAAAAAVLADLPARQARGVLGGLARAHLIEAAPGAAGRWRMHDLLRLYAQRLSDASADTDGREQARDRLLSYYLHTADAASQHLRALPGMAAPGGFTGRAGALAWLDAERPSLVAGVMMAADSGRDQVARRLPLLLAPYFDWRRRFDDWLATTAISLKAARDLGDRHGEGTALNNLGLALVKVRRFEEAITACQDAAAIYRETGDRHGEGTALNNLGLALAGVRRFEEAITAHQEDLAICRETGDRQGEGTALGQLGNAMVGVRRFEEAITAHQEELAIYRETGDRHAEGMALGNLGLALAGVRRFEEAITACQDAAAIYRETGDRHGEGMALGNLGNAMVGVRRFEEAITACQDAAAIFRETGDRHGEGMALGNLGETYWAMERYDDALADYNRAIELDPGSARLFAGRADTYRAMQRYDDALADCSRAIELDPVMDLAFEERGEIYRLTERNEEALADCTRAIELDPRSVSHFATRGYLYMNMQRYDRSLADYTCAIELDPGDAWLFAGRADTYRAMQRYDDALADYSRAIELDPGNPFTFAARGLSYQAMQRYDDALADYSHAIELDPNHVWAFVFRADTYRGMQRYDEALADCTRAIELDPKMDGGFSVRGNTYRLMGRYQEALADLTRAIELNPAFAWAISTRARMHRAMGHYDEALSDLDQAVELEPDNDGFLAEQAMTRGVEHRGVDAFQWVVDIQATAQDSASSARTITDWLISAGIVDAERTPCVPGKSGGYAPGASWQTAVAEAFPPDYLAASRRTTARARRRRPRNDRQRRFHGVEIAVGPAARHSLTVRTVTCPRCATNVRMRMNGHLTANWEDLEDAISFWQEGGPGIWTCPACDDSVSLRDWQFDPPMAFGHLALRFWNWPPLAPEFVAELSRRLGHRVVLITGKR
jgi:tetratricopeptide (TPR) repeat protein